LKPEKEREPFATSGGWKAGEPRVGTVRRELDRHTEIAELEHPRRRDQRVLRLDVAVHHAARVAVLEGREELGEEVAGERLGKRVLLVRVGEVLQ